MPGQRVRQLHPDLCLAPGGEDIDESVDRLARVVRVQRAEHEVAGLRHRQRGLDRVEVTHLAHEQDVGVGSKGGTDPADERARVEPDLALLDRRHVVLVDVLDRVFDRDDVTVRC